MKGFTLVEMLVALFIFGLLAAAGVSVMRFSVENQIAVRARAEELAALQRLRATLKADLGQAAPRRTRGADGQPTREAFEGGGGAGAPLIALVRRGWENPDGRARASLQYVEYRLVEDRLERRVRPAVDGAPLGRPQVLFEGVQAAGVQFFRGDAWLPVWDQPADRGLPQAVRLDLTLKGVGPLTQLFLTPGAAS